MTELEITPETILEICPDLDIVDAMVLMIKFKGVRKTY